MSTREPLSASLIVLESKNFTFQYGFRNPRRGRGHSAGGVWGLRTLHTYMDGLEMVYRAMTKPPWSRAPLATKIAVRVFDLASFFVGDGSPFTTLDEVGAPYIALPCRTNEPSLEAELRWAMAAAVHEATHVFNCRERSLLDPFTGAWAWFDEAIAVFMEMQLLPSNYDHFRFFGDWMEKPHLPLDVPSAWYQAGRFVSYLDKHSDLGVEFINRVWMESEVTETPLEALARLMPAGQMFLSADPDMRDVFASGYCLDSWFLEDPMSAAYAPELCSRFGERAVSESFVISAGDKVESGDALDHLACRYYRFYLEDGIGELHLSLRSPEAQTRAPLKAELAVATKEERCGRVIPLRPVADADGPLLTARVNQLNPDEVDYLILVVTNCGVRAAQINPTIAHDDGKQYTIRVVAA